MIDILEANKNLKDRARIAKTNKQRAKVMERRVANTLNGKRIPMSGAGYLKGDCIVYLPYDVGFFIIECKLRESYRSKIFINIPMHWLEKLDKDTRSMNAKFGILVIHYHGYTGDYAFIKKKDIQYLETLTQKSFNVPDVILEDMRYRKTGNPMRIMEFTRMRLLNELGSGYYQFLDDQYVCIHINTLKDILDVNDVQE